MFEDTNRVAQVDIALAVKIGSQSAGRVRARLAHNALEHQDGVIEIHPGLGRRVSGHR
jgi:hypothetical protein